MLYLETVEPATLGLLRELQESASSFMALKSLSYFEDAEIQPMPYMFSDLSWEETKMRVLLAIQALGQ